MESSDSDILAHRDWDPSYLQQLFSHDFFEYPELWVSNVTDGDLNKEMDKLDRYCLVTEDISLEDDVLYNAVGKIEHE